MFTGIVRVARLRKEDVNPRALEDINSLLKKQRGNAEPITEERLLKCLEKMAVVVALNDDERAVGLGVLTQSGGLNFVCAEIRHLVISDGLDILAVGMRIVAALCDIYLCEVEYIEGGASGFRTRK